MSFLFDVILLAIVALCTWRGYKSGILVTALGIVAIIISLVVGNVFAKAYSSEFAGILEPFASGLVDDSISEVTGLKTAEDGKTTEETEQVELVSERADADVYTVSYEALINMGIAKAPAEKIAEETAADSEEVNQSMTAALTENLCERIAFVAVFAVIFILTAIVFVVVENIADLKFRLPGAEKVNVIAGCVLGAVKGIMIVMFIASIFRYAGIILPESFITKTFILEMFINGNLVAAAVGI
jgi:uncharacterized integral membrane protein